MTSARFRLAVVDGEELQVVERESLNGVDATNTASHMGRWVRRSAEFAKLHPEFALGFRLDGPRKLKLWLLLLETRNGLQRVHIEHIACGQCGAMIDLANPTIPDLYPATPEAKEALDCAWAQPEVPCPRCGGGLERRAIWAAVAG